MNKRADSDTIEYIVKILAITAFAIAIIMIFRGILKGLGI